jgi:hypothetical protein
MVNGKCERQKSAEKYFGGKVVPYSEAFLAFAWRD